MDVDHIIYGVPDLDAGVASFAASLGIRPAFGGKHIGLGTHNALLSLGAASYLEIIAPDPGQPAPERPLPWGLTGLRGPRLLTWAVKAPDIEARAARAAAAGLGLGPVLRMSRERPDALRLNWALTFLPEMLGDGLVPFLIAWDAGPHPSETSPPGCLLLSLRGEHPEPDRIREMLDAVGVELPVTRAEAPALIAMIQGPAGTVELR